MSSGQLPSTANIDAFKEYIAKDALEMEKRGELKHTYDFFTYTFDAPDDIDNLGHTLTAVPSLEGRWKDLYIPLKGHLFPVPDWEFEYKESIYRTFEKTFEAFLYVATPRTYDVVLRINISSALNIRVLDRLLERFDTNKIYCCALNSITEDIQYSNVLYPRGDFIMMSHGLLEKLIPYMRKYMLCDGNRYDRNTIPHTDDCLIGASFYDYFRESGENGKYYDRYEMLLYNFIPLAEKDFPPGFMGDSGYMRFMEAACNPLAVTSRIKTVPKGQVSGWSWDWNDYRKEDSKKIKVLGEIMRKRGFKRMEGDEFYRTVIIDKRSERAKGAVAVGRTLVPLTWFMDNT